MSRCRVDLAGFLLFQDDDVKPEETARYEERNAGDSNQGEHYVVS